MKNNKIHKILGVITEPETSGRETFYYNELPGKKLKGMHELEIKGYLDQLEDDQPKEDRKRLIVQKSDATHFTRFYEPCRKAYLSGKYKEFKIWWVTLIQISAVVIPIAASIPTIIDALDRRQSPILRDTIDKQGQKIELLRRRISKDSTVLSSCLDSLKKQKCPHLFTPPILSQVRDSCRKTRQAEFREVKPRQEWTNIELF